MQHALDPSAIGPILDRLRAADRARAHVSPTASAERQPLHTVYGGAHLFRAETTTKLGALARAAFLALSPDAEALARTFELPEALARRVHPRVLAKLEAEPIEDYRIDFEDGFGPRPGDEEDAEALRCGLELGRAHAAGALPAFVGVRIKALGAETRARAIATLDAVVTATVDACGGALPAGFVVTLPKVESGAEVTAAADLCVALERKLSLPDGSLRLELMVEGPRGLVDEEGRLTLPSLLRAARGRCRGVHLGAYDYTAACGVAAAHQGLHHPAADFARNVMQLCLAGRGVLLADGATHVLPVAPHRGAGLSPEQEADNRRRVEDAHRLHFRHVTDALVRGFPQGWDLHPAQVVSRLVAVHAFYLESFEASAARLKHFVERAAQASLLGVDVDDAASGQGLLHFFLGAVASGAIPAEEVTASTGLSPSELAQRSFARILERRAQLPR